MSGWKKHEYYQNCLFRNYKECFSLAKKKSQNCKLIRPIDNTEFFKNVSTK